MVRIHCERVFYVFAYVSCRDACCGPRFPFGTHFGPQYRIQPPRNRRNNNTELQYQISHPPTPIRPTMTIGPRRAIVLRDCIATRFSLANLLFGCPGAILGAPLAGRGRGSGSPGERKRRFARAKNEWQCNPATRRTAQTNRRRPERN